MQKGRRLLGKMIFLADIARRIELNPEVELSKAKEENAYKLNHCTPQGRHCHLDWQKILVEKTAGEIVSLLRKASEAEIEAYRGQEKDYKTSSQTEDC